MDAHPYLAFWILVGDSQKCGAEGGSQTAGAAGQ